MSYTKKQRNKIYKKALASLPDHLFLCHAISKSATGFAGVYTQPVIFEMFPEFALFRPDPDITMHVWDLSSNPFMFDVENQLPRQIILDFCIAMTEN